MGKSEILYMICQYSFIFASKNVFCAPKSIYDISNLHVIIMLNFINFRCKVMSDIWYSICTMFSFICNVSWSIYMFCCVASLNHGMMCLEILVQAASHSWHGRKLHSQCEFLSHTDCYVVLENFMHSCWKLYVVWADLTYGGCSYRVILDMI